MKIEIEKEETGNFKIATIELLTSEECLIFKELISDYMDVYFEDTDDYPTDALACEIDQKFSPENYEEVDE